MATKKPAAALAQPANLSLTQMREALPRLEKRLRDLEGFNTTGDRESISEAAMALQQKYDLV